MEVADTVLGWDFLSVATLVTSWVLTVDESNRMEWLVNITNVVNDHAQNKRLLIISVRELLGNLGHVFAVFNRDFTLEEGSQVSKSTNDIVVWHLEVWVVRSITTFIVVWKVDEVPVLLERIALSLDVICKGSALSEWMVSFVFGERSVRLLENLKHVEGLAQNFWSFFAEESFGLSSNYKKKIRISQSARSM